jgi:uncharacterized membrane protein YoaK (UPF0700 family)
MTPEESRQASIRDLLLVALTFASGAADAIAFLGLGKVFSAFMTGNLVFLGIGIGGASEPDPPRVAAARAGFAVGVVLAVRIVRPTKGSGMWPPRVSAALGVALVAQAAFLVGWSVTSGRPAAVWGDVLVGLSALAFGAQSGAIMSLDVKGVFTTAATATVIMLLSDEAGWSRSAAERRRFAGVLLGLVAGATAGTLLLRHARTYAGIVPFVVTGLVIAGGSLVLKPSR